MPKIKPFAPPNGTKAMIIVEIDNLRQIFEIETGYRNTNAW